MPPLLEAKRIPDGWRGMAWLGGRGIVTYRLVAVRAPRLHSERREATRARARLRSAKLLDMNFVFLADAVIRDRSPAGARLRVQDADDLPADVYFYDDETTRLRRARIAWRRSGEIGLRLLTAPPARELTRTERAALAGRYYAAR